jgi:hypothetical protein
MPGAGTTPPPSLPVPPAAPVPEAAAPSPDASRHLAARVVETGSGNGHAPDAGAVRPNGHAVPPLGNGHAVGNGASDGPTGPVGCTAPQLRRFIKSRSWVPMHELRRRFAINGGEDDVTPVAVDGSTIFVGLPTREGRLLGELFQAGDIGYELSMDPYSPIVIGVYPMRPVPRH